MNNMAKLALGAIANYLNSVHPYIDFIANARAHGYELEKLIICYSHGYKEESLERLQQTVDTELVQINFDPDFKDELREFSLSKKEIDFFLRTPEFDYHQLIPYGKRRNLVLIKALISKPKIDYLFFIDTDVKPRLLLSKTGRTRVINFFGRHLHYLERENVIVTTSDYSGYYIIPPLDFDDSKILLCGLQKDKAYDRVKNLSKNLCTADEKQQNIRESKKILGGNHALDLNYSSILPPYYSTTYIYRGELYLGRGEDTLLGLEITDSRYKIIDIDTPIFHNTYGNFPKEPDIKDENVQERLFYACTGWLGRNPFLNWYLLEKGFIGLKDFKKRHKIQSKAIKKGAPKLAAYTKNENFNKLPEMFSAAWLQLDSMVEEYEELIKHWDSIMGKISERRNKL
jgi:hypothetical protein